MTEAQNPAEPFKNTSASVELEEPIKRSGGDVVKFSLRKPKGGDLRGIPLKELAPQGDISVDTLMILVPRISDPHIIAEEVAELSAPDVLEVAGTIAGFFWNRSFHAMVNATLKT